MANDTRLKHRSGAFGASATLCGKSYITVLHANEQHGWLEPPTCPKCRERLGCPPLPATDATPTQNGFTKNDAGKVRLDLIAPAFELDLGKALTFGAKTYGVGNYLKGAPYSRYLAAAKRHLNAWARGENLDDGPGGTGCSHLANAAACLQILFESQRLGVGEDDRAAVTGPSTPEPTKPEPTVEPLHYYKADGRTWCGVRAMANCTYLDSGTCLACLRAYGAFHA